MLSAELKEIIVSILNKKENDIITEINKVRNKYSEYDSKFLYIMKELANELFNFEYSNIPFTHMEKEIDTEIRNDMEWVATLDINIRLRAKIYDCLWIHSKDYNAAFKAYSEYCNIIKSSINFESNYYFLNRIISITLNLGENTIPKGNLTMYVDIVLQQGKDDKTACSLNLLEACFKNNLLEMEQIIDICKQKIHLLKDSNNIIILEGYLDLLENLYAKKENIKLVQKPINSLNITHIRRMKADMYIRHASTNPSRTGKSIENIKKAVNILKQVNDTEDERLKLLKELDFAQKEFVKNMPVTEHSIDITDYVNKIKNDIEKLNIDEAIFYLATLFPIIKKKDIQDKVIKDAHEYPLAHMFPVSLINKHGKIKAHIPSINLANPYEDEKVLIANMEFTAQKLCNIYADAYIKNVLYFVNEKFNIEEANIDRIIENSIFVPPKRRRAFTIGIMSGFRYDFISALSILIPQVEFAVRCMAECLGDVTFNINESGLEEYKTFSAVLDLQNINEALDEDLLFNLKSIFTSKYGMNIRNEISHGCFDDNDFSSLNALYAWWFILSLCYIFAYDIYRENCLSVYEKLKKM